jgi:hypothetical protein
MMETKIASENLIFSSNMKRPIGREGLGAFIRRETFNYFMFMG